MMRILTTTVRSGSVVERAGAVSSSCASPGRSHVAGSDGFATGGAKGDGEHEGALVQLNGWVYQNIVENIHEGLYLTDTDRVITFWNKAAAEITGFSADEVVGPACFDNILTHIDGKGNQTSGAATRCPSGCSSSTSIASRRSTMPTGMKWGTGS